MIRYIYRTYKNRKVINKKIKINGTSYVLDIVFFVYTTFLGCIFFNFIEYYLTNKKGLRIPDLITLAVVLIFFISSEIRDLIIKIGVNNIYKIYIIKHLENNKNNKGIPKERIKIRIISFIKLLYKLKIERGPINFNSIIIEIYFIFINSIFGWCFLQLVRENILSKGEYYKFRGPIVSPIKFPFIIILLMILFYIIILEPIYRKIIYEFLKMEKLND